MTPKGADLDATDLIEVSTIVGGSYVTKSITGQELIDAIPAPTGFVPTSRTLTINGVTQDLSADRTFTIATGLTVGTTPIASGTVGRVLFQGTGNVLQQSAGLSWDDVNSRLSLGPTGGSAILAFPNTTSGFSPVIQSQFGGNSLLFLIGGRTFNLNGGGTITTNFNTTITGSTGNAALVVAQGNSGWSPVADFNGSSGTALRVNTNGNVLIGTTTDAGFRLDVNGTARVQGNAQFGTGFYWDNTNGRLGIGGTPIVKLQSYNSSNGTSAGFGGTAYGIRFDNGGAFSSGRSTIFGVDNTFTGSYQPLSIEASSITLQGVTTGNVLIGTTTDAGFKLNVIGTGRFNGTLDIRGANQNRIFLNNNAGTNSGFLVGRSVANDDAQNFFIYDNLATSTRFHIASTGNVGINTTTDAGFRLDVNGTARVQGPSTYSMVYDSNGVFNLNGTYARLDLFNQSGSLRARLNCDGPNGTLTLYQNATGYIFLNGAQTGNNSYISTALSIGNQSAANASSILELTSTTKGFLPPRMTTTQKNAITSPATGLQVYDTTLNRPCFYDGTTWITL